VPPCAWADYTDIDLAEGVGCSVDEGLALILLGDVGLEREGPAALLLDVRHNGRGVIRAGEVVHDHGSTFAGKCQGDAASHAIAGGPGDECDFVFADHLTITPIPLLSCALPCLPRFWSYDTSASRLQSSDKNGISRRSN